MACGRIWTFFKGSGKPWSGLSHGLTGSGLDFWLCVWRKDLGVGEEAKTNREEMTELVQAGGDGGLDPVCG